MRQREREERFEKSSKRRAMSRGQMRGGTLYWGKI